MKALVLLSISFLFASVGQAERQPDRRESGYQREATGDQGDLPCPSQDSPLSLAVLAAYKIQQQANAYIERNKDYRGCSWVDEVPVLARREVDYVDGTGGVSRFFVFEGRVTCGGVLGYFKREKKIPKVVQHYRHATDPGQDRCR